VTKKIKVQALCDLCFHQYFFLRRNFNF